MTTYTSQGSESFSTGMSGNKAANREQTAHPIALFLLTLPPSSPSPSPPALPYCARAMGLSPAPREVEDGEEEGGEGEKRKGHAARQANMGDSIHRWKKTST